MLLSTETKTDYLDTMPLSSAYQKPAHNTLHIGFLFSVFLKFTNKTGTWNLKQAGTVKN